MASFPATGNWDDAATWSDTDTWFDGSITGSGLLASFEQTVLILGTGSLASIEQSVSATGVGNVSLLNNIVGYKGSGRITDFVQEIVFLEVGQGQSVVSIAQTINATSGNENVVTFKQRVRDLNVEAYKPFTIEINVGNAPNIVTMPDEWLTDDITITRSEDDAALMEFTLLLPEGQVSSDFLDGSTNKDVELVYTDTESGISEILFTGKVDIPDIDLLRGTITYRCTDNRRANLNRLNANFADNIGFWSDEIFSEPTDLADEIESRLETVRASLNFNSKGLPEFTSWTPKTTADRVLSGNEIYRRKPSIELLSRARVVNTINLELEYQYQRIKQREQNYSWNYGASPAIAACEYGRLGWPPTKAAVIAAIEGTGWTYTDFQSTKRYCGYCPDTYSNIPCGERTGAGYYDVYDAAGNPVTDSSGKIKQEWSSGKFTDSTYKDVHAASWKMAKRYTQNISEKVSVTVRAQNSIDRYGQVSRTQKYGVNVEFDESIWENDDLAYLNPAAVPTTTGTITMGQLNNGEYYYDLNNYADATGLIGSARWQNLYRTAIERAMTTIAKSHRDNTVSVEIPMNIAIGATDAGRKPMIELSSTVELANNDWLACKGKVGAIRYTIDLVERDAYAEVDIKLSLSAGNGAYNITFDAQGDRPQDRNTKSETLPATIYLDSVTHIRQGEELNANHNGHIVMRTTEQHTNRYGGTRYAFVVDAPCIASEYRDTAEYLNSVTKEYGVRVDPLTVSFNR